MKKRLAALLITISLLPACTGPNEAAEKSPSYSGFRPVGSQSVMSDPSQWGELNTHDPSIFRMVTRIMFFLRMLLTVIFIHPAYKSGNPKI